MNCLVIDAPKISHEQIVTNDLVELINDHQFILLGRIDNVVNSGGIKLIPEQRRKIITWNSFPIL
jgi:O-succinylbenzoic acid--CoA ligase